jgi:hypothetical protein
MNWQLWLYVLAIVLAELVIAVLIILFWRAHLQKKRDERMQLFTIQMERERQAQKRAANAGR